MRGVLIALAYVVLIAAPVALQIRRVRKKRARALKAAEKGKLFSEGPRGEHPQIDLLQCIGCGACVDVCPEGDVLGVIAGKAAIVNGMKCIGHGLCAEACPVGAITIVKADPRIAADLPRLTPEYETNVPNLFVVGELGGLALIKNAVNEGRECIDIITRRLASPGARSPFGDVHDICVVGAGPGGISATLRAIQNKLRCITLEQDEFGGTVAKFPRQKLVMTSPVEFPMFGRFKKMEISKEELLRFWKKVFLSAGLRIQSCERAVNVERGPDGIFRIETTKGAYRARAVVLALGRRGTPRRLGIEGEQLPKVMYSLIDAEAYRNVNILVVGGGDSAVEVAMGLAHQPGNRVTLSYRREALQRIKERNLQRIEDCMRKKVLEVVFNSNPVEIKERSVVLDVLGERREIPNDYVFVFAGGLPAKALLEKIGIASGERDLTNEARAEADLAGAGTTGAGRPRAYHSEGSGHSPAMPTRPGRSAPP